MSITANIAENQVHEKTSRMQILVLWVRETRENIKCIS